MRRDSCGLLLLPTVGGREQYISQIVIKGMILGEGAWLLKQSTLSGGGGGDFFLTYPTEMFPLRIRRPNIHAEAYQRDVRIFEPCRVVVDSPDIPQRELDRFVVDGDSHIFCDTALVLFRPGIMPSRHAPVKTWSAPFTEIRSIHYKISGLL